MCSVPCEEMLLICFFRHIAVLALQKSDKDKEKEREEIKRKTFFTTQAEQTRKYRGLNKKLLDRQTNIKLADNWTHFWTERQTDRYTDE